MSSLHDAIASINSGSRFVLLCGQEIQIDDPLPPIYERGYLDMRGSVVSSNMDSGSTLFTLSGGSIHINGGSYFCNNHPHDILWFESGGDCSFGDAVVTNAGTIARWGGVNGVNRCSVRNVTGSYGGSGAIFAMNNCSNARLENIAVNGKGNNYALVSMFPVPGGFIDTVMMSRVGLQSFQFENVFAGSDFGILINTKDGKVVNLWASDCYFDHTTKAGIKIISPTHQSFITRNIRLTNVRNDADGGRNIEISGPGGHADDVLIFAPHFHCPNPGNIYIESGHEVRVLYEHKIIISA